MSLRDTRRRTVELALIEYYYLSVRIMHRGSVVARYVVDLRFVDPAPRRERQLGWPWLAAGALFMSLAIAGAHAIASGRAPWWHHEWLPATAALFGLGGCAMFAGFQLSRETLALVSAHGRARLLAHAGHLGTFRALRTFLPRLAAHLDVAFRARRSSRAKQLRDEMREHFRLREAGAISEAEYESAKRRILATHMSSAVRTRVRHAPNKKARESPPGPFDRT